MISSFYHFYFRRRVILNWLKNSIVRENTDSETICTFIALWKIQFDKTTLSNSKCKLCLGSCSPRIDFLMCYETQSMFCCVLALLPFYIIKYYGNIFWIYSEHLSDKYPYKNKMQNLTVSEANQSHTKLSYIIKMQ